MIKRSKEEILFDILDVLHKQREGANRSYIFHSANLNFPQGQRYLDWLSSHGHVIILPIRHTDWCMITNKGSKLRQLIEPIRTFLE